MLAKATIFSLMLVTAICLSTTASLATFLVCPTVQEAKNLLQGALNILRADRDYGGNATSAETPYANCKADRLIKNPGTLLSKGHYVLVGYIDGKSRGIANASIFLEQIKKVKVISSSMEENQINLRMSHAWLYKKIIDGKERGIISVK